MKVRDTDATYYPNGIAVGVGKSYAADADGNILAGSGTSVGGVKAVTGTATQVTGLTTISAAVVSLKSDASLAGVSTTCTWAGGTLTIKVWKATSTADCTPIAATVAKDVSWVAVGT